MLPITLQMQIDLSAAAHKREIAEGFAKLRDRLIPKPTQRELYMQALMEAMRPATPQELYGNMFNGLGWNPYTHPLQAANSIMGGNMLSGLAGCGLPWRL